MINTSFAQSRMKTRIGLKTFVITMEICLLSAGAQCFQWHLKPSSQTIVESGKNLTISWGYTLDNDEKFFQLAIYLNNDANTIARIIDQKTYIGKAYNNKTMVTSRNSTVSLAIFFVIKQNIGQKYCASLSGVKGSSDITKVSCTTLLVYERPRITYRTPNIARNFSSVVELTCNASGDPKPSIDWMKMAANNTPSHFSNSSTTTFEITGTEKLGNYCCIAANKYGNDTGCTNVSIGDKPMLLNTTPTFYNMTDSNVTIACRAAGNPTPIITWTSANSTSSFISQSNDGNYTVRLKSCINKTLIFYCKASNLMGETPWKKVIVIVNTLAQCSKTNLESTEPPGTRNTNNFTTVHIVIVVIVIVVVVVAIGLLAFTLKRKQNKRHSEKCIYARGNKSENQLPERKPQFIVESPYGEPIDCIKSPVKTRPLHATVPSYEFEIQNQQQKSQIMEENPYGEPIDSIRSPLKTNTSIENASAEEAGITGQKRKKLPDVLDSTYASVMTSRSPKKSIMRIGKNSKKEKKESQGPQTPLYEELPALKDTRT